MQGIAKTVTIAGVDVDIADGPVGISLSGGADSALLCYILLSNHPGPVHAFSCVSGQKGYAAGSVSQRVLQRCIELTGNDRVVHHSYYVPMQDNGSLIPTQLEYMKLGIYGTRYVAVTANPPHSVCASFKDPPCEPEERDPNVIKPHYFEPNTYLPFNNVDKRVIAAMYGELDLLQSLFPVTRSCESTDMYSDHCGRCWWCQERAWAFGTLR